MWCERDRATEYRNYRLRGRFIYKSIYRQFSQLHISSGKRVVTVYIAVEFLSWLKFKKKYNISTGFLSFRTIIFWCFAAEGTELRTAWFARLEPGSWIRETKNGWIPQSPHRYRSCRVQVGDLNDICTVLLGQQ